VTDADRETNRWLGPLFDPGLGLAIAATALLPLSHALTGSLRPRA
jgi:hypothetical protein